MNKKVFSVLIYLLAVIILAACGPSQAELDAQATQVAADLSATQTAEAPTPTPTPTVTSTNTPTATHTPLPTNTPTPTSTHTPPATPTFSPTPTATDTPLPTSTYTPTASPSPTVSPSQPTVTPLFETPYVLGNLQMEFIPYGENVILLEPPIEVAPIFPGEEGKSHKITDPAGDYALSLSPGEYEISVLEVKAANMPESVDVFIPSLHFEVPPIGCNYLGEIQLSFYRLPPGEYAEHRATIIELEEQTGIEILFTYLDSGHLVPKSFVVNLPSENERVEGVDNCTIKLAEFEGITNE